MAKRLEDLHIHQRPQLNLLIMCQCGCGEVCNDGREYVEIKGYEGEYYAEESHWARVYGAEISGDTVTYWNGETVDYDDWKAMVTTHG